MIKQFLLIIFLFSLLFSDTFAFEGLLFRPLTANPFEPRIGSQYEFDSKKLRLDIGTSVDLMSFNLNDNKEIRIGGDFFTFTRLRTAGNFKFPVETSDYFFGANATSNYRLFGQNTEFRLRIAHISSHLVDGLSNDTVFLRTPFVYSREFTDLVGAINFEPFRFYIGFQYLFSTKPANFAKYIPQLGFDFKYEINQLLAISGGYDFKLIGVNGVEKASNAAQAGILINTSNKTGILLSLYYFGGRSMHGMFFMDENNYFGAGFQLIFY